MPLRFIFRERVLSEIPAADVVEFGAATGVPVAVVVAFFGGWGDVTFEDGIAGLAEDAPETELKVGQNARVPIDLGEVHVARKGFKQRERLSRRHFAIGRITYPGETEHGYLLYFKSSVTGDEDEVVTEYRSRKSTFPHESTADQFFDEGQFEAYRALGEHMAKKALAAHSGAKDSYSAFQAWFGELAERLPHRWAG